MKSRRADTEMSSNNTIETTPLLSDVKEDEGRCWWKNALDLEEAKNQVLFSLPMILTNLVYYSLTLISVMFAGHLGEIQLAGATLANSWATVTGFAFMTGLSGALETLCGQGFGAKTYRILGIYLQSSCIISCAFAIAISVLWFYTEPVLILLQQDAEISRTAALYIKFLIPGLFAYGLVQNILRFFQSQSILMPLVWFSVLPLALHLGIVYCLVTWTDLGFKGAPLAASISLWISLLLLAFYVVLSKRFELTWTGFSFESFRFVLANLKLALPSAAMVCLEYWAFELLVLLAGLMPNSEVTTSLIAMCVNTETIAYMTTYGLSAAASTKVSNELGAGNPRKAKTAMAVSLQLSVLLALAVVLALAFGHNIWAASFSNSASIINQFASMTPWLLISITLDSFQGILSGFDHIIIKSVFRIFNFIVTIDKIKHIFISDDKFGKNTCDVGVARGIGWQVLAMWANLGTFYFIGMPIACLLAFKLNLYAKGLWIGLICGLCCQAGALLVIALFRKWTKIELS